MKWKSLGFGGQIATLPAPLGKESLGPWQRSDVKRFLVGIAENLVRVNWTFKRQVGYSPLIFSERQVYGLFTEAILRTHAKVLTQPAVRRKTKKQRLEGQRSSNKRGWADFLVVPESDSGNILFIELKHHTHNTTYPNWRCKRLRFGKAMIDDWKNAVTQIEQLKDRASDWLLKGAKAYGLAIMTVPLYSGHDDESKVDTHMDRDALVGDANKLVGGILEKLNRVQDKNPDRVFLVAFPNSFQEQWKEDGKTWHETYLGAIILAKLKAY